MSLKPVKSQISAEDFSNLILAEQIDLLRGLDARQKTRLLLDAENGAELMAEMPTQEIYLLAVERGPEYLPELLGMATPEQWTGFIDLDCWEGDSFDSAKTHRWLVSLLQCEDETIFDILRGMNFEQLVMMLKSEMDILSGPEADENSDARIDAIKRDGGYEISYRSENSSKMFSKILDVLQSFEAEFFVFLLEAVRAESISLIEESVYQQRSGRLQDIGIPDPFMARKVYAWLDPDEYQRNRPFKISPGVCDGSAPGFPVTLVRPKGLLAAALVNGLDEGLAWEMASLANKVMLADRIDMGNLEQVSDVIGKVDATLNLALEWLIDDDVSAAENCLKECYCEDLFRIGFSLTLRLQYRAAAIVRSSIAPYLEANAKACVAALNQFPPLLFEGVTDPAHGGTRLFTSLAEIGSVEKWLTKIELQLHLFEKVLNFKPPQPEELDLSGCQPSEADELTLVEFFLTALANRLLGRDFMPLPIAEEELAGLHGMVSQSGILNQRLREESIKWLESLHPGGGDFAAYCLDIWEEEFCSVGFEDIDPRFVGGVIVRLDVAESPG